MIVPNAEVVLVETVAQPATTRAVAPAPKSLIRAHDPAIVEEGGVYHLAATNGGLRQFSSKDLVRWEARPPVFATLPAWTHEVAGEKPGLWAPDLVLFGGKWHCYYSVSTFGKQRSAIGLATSASLEDQRWEDHGRVIESFPGGDFNAIDPSVFLDHAGKPWMAFGSHWKGIHIVELDAATGLPAQGARPALIASRKDSASIEAAYVYEREGWYYLVTSWDLCCRGVKSTYRMVMGRSREPAGPYLDREGRSLTDGGGTSLLRGYGFNFGPGQASVVRRGGEWLMGHHYYDGRVNGAPSLAVRPMYFDAEGWPMLGEAIGEERERHATWAGEYSAWTDEANERAATFREDGTVTLGSELGTWKDSPDGIEVALKGETLAGRSDGGRNGFVARRADGTVLRVVRTLGDGK